MYNLESAIDSIMGNIIKKYNFSKIIYNEESIFLVSKEFALIIYVNLEGIDIYYVMPKSKHELVEYRISNFVQSKFTEEDREYYGMPSTNEERIFAELKVLASGLVNNWADLLSGDKTWLKKYQGNGMKANQFVLNILSPAFFQQT
jgi:hypothetical protein